ncbi:MAG: VTT domain-containing protein [Trueperaceae bacterium]|nr:VTT domain-containing protein [Trueperaceae bacterium]
MPDTNRTETPPLPGTPAPHTPLWYRFAVAGLWLVLIVLFWRYAQQAEGGVRGLLAAWVETLATERWGPLLLLGIYALRPLLLLPSTILTVACGFLFGAWWGIVYATVATVGSSTIAYLIGRLFGRGAVAERSPYRLITAIRERTFETVLISRLIFLPGDLVNYVGGFLRIPFGAFALATAVGGMPSLAMAVLTGASVQGSLRDAQVTLNPWYLLAAGVLLVFSLGVSRVLRSRFEGLSPAAPNPGQASTTPEDASR